MYRDGTSVGETPSPGYTVGGLSGGSSYALAVDAVDAAGNRSARTSLVASTGSCQDAQMPSAPGSLTQSNRTETSITLSWQASSDNVGVTGYRLFNGSTQVTTLTGTIHTFKGLNAGTAYTFGVEAYDAANNTSARATKSATTTAAAACDAGGAVAKLNHGQAFTANGSACIELTVNPAWNPVDVLLEQTGGNALSYAYKSCTGSGSGTINAVVRFFTGNNPGCNFFVQLTGSGTVVYYD